MDNEQVIQDANDKKASIDAKMKKVLGKIEEWMNQIDDIPNTYSKNSKQYQDKKRKSLEGKIEQAQKDLDEWLKNQQSKLDEWLNDKLESILKDSKREEESMQNSRKKFEER